MMERRTFLGVFAGGLLATPLTAEAQQQIQKSSRVSVLLNLYSPEADPPQALRQRLHDLGYVEGQNLVIDWRYQLGGSNRLPALAAELVSLKPNVIVADVAVAIRAAMRATSTIPIVMATGADPVAVGLVANFRQPGGNVTGMTTINSELAAKRLELIRIVVPRASRIAILWDEKGSALVDLMSPHEMDAYAKVCGSTLAHAHARSGDRIAIAAYLGASPTFDRAVAEYAAEYAELNERDYRALWRAVDDGRVAAEEGI